MMKDIYFNIGIICCVFEGWSSQSKKKDGTIHIMMWLLSSSEHQFTDHIQSVATTEMVDILQMSQTGLSNVLVNVEVSSNNWITGRSSDLCCAF